MRARRQHASQRQFANDVDHSRQIGLSREIESERSERLGSTQQPHASPRYDAEARLSKQTLEIGSDAPLVRVPGRAAAGLAAARPQLRTVRKNDLEAAERAEVVVVSGHSEA